MSRTKKPPLTKAGVFALFVGAGIGALTFFVFAPGNLVITAIAAVGGTLVGRIVAPRPAARKRTAEQLMVADGVTKEMLTTALRSGMDKLNRLKNEAFKITSVPVRSEVDAICAVIARILINIKNDPQDLRQARQFLDYYLDATIKIVARYVDLSTKGVRSIEIDETLAKVESSLHTIHRAFERQLELLLQNDVLDLDAELTVLTQTIKLEGLGPVAQAGVPTTPTSSTQGENNE